MIKDKIRENIKGNLKEAFEEWCDLENEYPTLCEYSSHDRGACYSDLDILDLPMNLYYGALVDFFASLDIYIEIGRSSVEGLYDYNYRIDIIKNKVHVFHKPYIVDINHARIIAINKAIELCDIENK